MKVFAALACLALLTGCAEDEGTGSVQRAEAASQPYRSGSSLQLRSPSSPTAAGDVAKQPSKTDAEPSTAGRGAERALLVGRYGHLLLSPS